MKLFLMSLITLVGAAAIAAPNSEQIKKVLEAQTACQSFVRFDDANVYLGFGYYTNMSDEVRVPVPGSVEVVPLDGSASYSVALADSPVDMITAGGRAFILTHTSLVELDLASHTLVAEHATTSRGDNNLQFKQHAEGMARYKNELVVAHGRLGVSMIDMVTGAVTKEIALATSQAPLESMAVAVTVQGHFAYVAMDDYTLVQDGAQPYRGLITIDLDTNTVVSQPTGMDPGSDALLSDATGVIVSFMGFPLLKYPINQLNGKKMPNPSRRVYNFQPLGHPTGSPAMDDTYYYTCYYKHDQDSTKPVVRLPLALSRASLGL